MTVTIALNRRRGNCLKMYEATYRTVVLFGKEDRSSVREPDRFARLAREIAASLSLDRVRLRHRGYIAGSRAENVAPRAGVWSESALQSWLRALANGRFTKLELFGPDWAKGKLPAVYGSLTKLWSGPFGDDERTRHGAENSITLAVPEHLIHGDPQWVDNRILRLAGLSDAFYGFAEMSVGWDRPVRLGASSRTYLMDMRWHDIPGSRYRRGKYLMDDYAAGIYWANLLRPDHLTVPLSNLPTDAVAHAENLGETLYVRFSEDPHEDDQLHARLSSLFNVVPTAKCLGSAD